jgi:hypothetical protein
MGKYKFRFAERNVAENRFAGSKASSFLFAAFLFFCCAFAAQNASGQELQAGDIAPPPLKILPKEEKKQLDETPDLKKRTMLALALMEARLKRAESLDSQNQYEQMYQEFGAFHALIDYTLNFLYRSNDGRRANLNNFKRFEMGLRTFPARIEVIRRELPLKYESYLRSLLVIIRDTRSKAVEPFFSDSVVPQRNNAP